MHKKKATHPKAKWRICMILLFVSNPFDEVTSIVDGSIEEITTTLIIINTMMTTNTQELT
ncbi:hypothetical protein NRM5_008740 [Chlamydia psittaci]|nr:hypothetical protein NRM5_008740 [Chlamydia psittaci]